MNNNKKKKSKLGTVVKWAFTITITITLAITLKFEGNNLTIIFGGKTKDEAATIELSETPVEETDETEQNKVSTDDQITSQETDLGQDIPVIDLGTKDVNRNDTDTKANTISVIPVSTANNNEGQQEEPDSQLENAMVNKDYVSADKNDSEVINDSDNYSEADEYNNDTFEEIHDNNNQLGNSEENEEYPSLTTSVCQVNIETPSQLALFSNNKVDNNSTINISYVDSETQKETCIGSYELDKVVNENSSESDVSQINYMQMPSGTFLFVFENCNFNEFDFCIIDELLPNDSIEEEEKNDNIPIPSKEKFQVKINKKNTPYRIGIMPSYTFSPLIKFCSEGSADYVIKICDDFEKELIRFNLKQTENAVVQNIDIDFELEKDKQYYMEIFTMSEKEEENIYYFEIIDKMIEKSVTDAAPDSIKQF